MSKDLPVKKVWFIGFRPVTTPGKRPAKWQLAEASYFTRREAKEMLDEELKFVGDDEFEEYKIFCYSLEVK